MWKKKFQSIFILIQLSEMHGAEKVKTSIYINNWWTLKIYFLVLSSNHFIPKTSVNLKAKCYLTEFYLLISYGEKGGKIIFQTKCYYSLQPQKWCWDINWTQTSITWIQFFPPLQTFTWLRCLHDKSPLTLTLS